MKGKAKQESFMGDERYMRFARKYYNRLMSKYRNSDPDFLWYLTTQYVQQVRASDEALKRANKEALEKSSAEDLRKDSVKEGRKGPKKMEGDERSDEENGARRVAEVLED